MTGFLRYLVQTPTYCNIRVHARWGPECSLGGHWELGR